MTVINIELPLLSPDQLRSRILDCEACSARKECRSPTPFFPRETRSEVMMIGRNPGINEDIKGIPFVGRGGQVFEGWLRGLGIARDQIWLTNLLKCYTTKDRPPKKVEINTCWDLHLRRELQFCKPSFVVALGSEAFTATTGHDKLSLRHGMLYDRRSEIGAWVIGVIHPGSAMRSSSYLEMMVEDGIILKPLLPWALSGQLREYGLPRGYGAQ